MQQKKKKCIRCLHSFKKNVKKKFQIISLHIATKHTSFEFNGALPFRKLSILKLQLSIYMYMCVWVFYTRMIVHMGKCFSNTWTWKSCSLDGTYTYALLLECDSRKICRILRKSIVSLIDFLNDNIKNFMLKLCFAFL